MNETIPQPELDEVCSSLTLHLNHDDIAQGQLGHLVDLLDPAHNEPALLRHLRGKVAFAFELNARRHSDAGRPVNLCDILSGDCTPNFQDSLGCSDPAPPGSHCSLFPTRGR